VFLRIDYFNEGERDLAIKNLTIAIKLNGSNADYYLWRGLVHYSTENIYQGRTKRQLEIAIDDFKKAIKLRGHDNIKDYYWLVKSYHQMGDLANRNKFFERILKVDSNHVHELTQRLIHLCGMI